jgi:hypothetical protein
LTTPGALLMLLVSLPQFVAILTPVTTLDTEHLFVYTVQNK